MNFGYEKTYMGLSNYGIKYSNYMYDGEDVALVMMNTSWYACYMK